MPVSFRPVSFSPIPYRVLPSQSPVMVAAGSVWALLFGMGVLLLGNGLQYSLLGVRAANEGFSGAVTGLVMSGYFVGFLAGSLVTPRAVHRVGHLRVFAAVAGLASIAILVQSLFVTPVVWGVMRIATGFAYAGAYIVTESWLNDSVTNEHRGGLLSVYMVVSYLGMGGGQLLLNAGNPNEYELFILVSVLISFASIPILLSVLPQPATVKPMRLSPLQLYRISPLGTVGCFATGLLQGALFSMGAVYARSTGLTVAQVSVFMFVMIAGAALFQWPIGKLSDHMDRRRLIAIVALAGALTCAVAVPLGDISAGVLIALAVPIGLAPLTLYSLSIAYTNDRLDHTQRVAAGSILILIFGFGAVLGPSTAGAAMDLAGPSGYLWVLAGILALMALFAFYRMYCSPAPPVESQSPYALMPQRTASLSPAYVDSIRNAEQSGDNDQSRESSTGFNR